MAYVLIMPRQGNTVESCIIGEWKVKEGDAVKADTPVCAVETDKATFEIPAGADGSVLKILHPEGDDVPVLKPIMVVGSPGENLEAALPADSVPAAAASTPAAAAPAVETGAKNAPAATPNAVPAAAPVQAASGPIAVSPRAKKLAFEEAVNPAEIAGSGPGGRVIEQDIAAYLSQRPPLTAAAKDELRKRIAAGLPANVPAAGSAVGGRVALGELDSGAAPQTAVKTAATESGFAGVGIADEYTDAPIKGIRKLIADQMMKSHNTTAAFTLNSAAVAVKIQELRARFKAAVPELGV
jgi:pyruvate dehydrogenase E2 component (dihydrolipoamide acetyltransferase)